MKENHAEGELPADADPLAGDRPARRERPLAPQPDELPPVETPPVRRAAGAAAPHRTTFGQPDPTDQPYRRPSRGKKAAVIVVVVLVIAALIGGGVWYFLSRQPDENLALAEQYMPPGRL